ncbi:unnamed protein product [Microthlaspi erraticum]|uniref:Retrotransposon gag domain-containing protein n=1 Tax=Microthlaspi erraticum TaxID=1685480 RepID=A0A6D2HZC1_9BRAS|nr:unnamed protein product [Microthlaspi erraticum]
MSHAADRAQRWEAMNRARSIPRHAIKASGRTHRSTRKANDYGRPRSSPHDQDHHITADPDGRRHPLHGRPEVTDEAVVTFSTSIFTAGSGVPPMAWVQQGAAIAERPRAAAVGVPPYLEIMGHMQRKATPLFEGGVGPEEADEWHLRLERNFHSIRCPLEYQVELVVHYLSGDTYLW